MIVSKFYATSRNQQLSNRAWGASPPSVICSGLLKLFPDEDPSRTWALMPHEPNTPVKEAGETYLRLSLGPGSRGSISAYNHSGTDQDWYPVLEGKHHRPGVVAPEFERDQPDSPSVVSIAEDQTRLNRFNSTSARNGKCTPLALCPIVQTGSEPNQMSIRFTGPGNFNVDDFRIFRSDTSYLDYSAKEYQRIHQSGISALRTHATVKTDGPTIWSNSPTMAV